MVGVSERDYLGHKQPYLGSSIYDSSMYDSIDIDVNDEVIAYQGPYWDVQHYVETYLIDVLSWLGQQGRAVRIRLGQSIKSNPYMMNTKCFQHESDVLA